MYMLLKVKSSHPHLLEVGGEVLTLGDHRDVVVLAFLLRHDHRHDHHHHHHHYLGHQLEPPLHRALDYLTE